MKRIWDEVMSPRAGSIGERTHSPSRPSVSAAYKDSIGQPQSPNTQRVKHIVRDYSESLANPESKSFANEIAVLSRERRLPYKDHADIVQAKVGGLRRGATNMLKDLNLSHDQYARRAKSKARRELQDLREACEERVVAEKKAREAEFEELSRMKQLVAEINRVQVELIDRERLFRIKSDQEERAHQSLVGEHAEISAELERLKSTTVELDDWTEKIRQQRSTVDSLLAEQTRLVSAAEAIDEEIRFAGSYDCHSRRLQLLNRIRKQRISKVKQDTAIARDAVVAADESLQQSQPVFHHWREGCREIAKQLLSIVDRSLEGYALLHRALNCSLCEKPLDKDPMINDEGITYCATCSASRPKLCADTPNSVIESILSRFPANLQFETYLGSLKDVLETEVERIESTDIAKLVKHYKAYVTLLETNNGRFDMVQLLALKRKEK